MRVDRSDRWRGIQVGVENTFSLLRFTKKGEQAMRFIRFIGLLMLFYWLES